MGYGPISELLDGTLTESSLSTNIKRSFDQYIKVNIETGEGYNVNYEGVPFDDAAIGTWIQPRILDFSREYHRQGSGTEYATTNNIFFQINIFVKKSAVTLADIHYNMRDVVAGYFRIGQDITLRDYIASGSTAICNMRVRDVVTDTPMPETNEFLQYAVAWEIDFTEMVTKP